MNPCTTPPRTHPDTPGPTAAPDTSDTSRLFGIETALARAGVSQRLLRQCEARRLIEGIDCADASGPRYTLEHISVLRFARRALALGFGTDEIATLLTLWRNEHRASAEVKHLALSRTEALASRIEELQAMKRVLERLADLCRGDHQSDCPILDELIELKGFASQWQGEAARPPAATASSAGCRCAPASR